MPSPQLLRSGRLPVVVAVLQLYKLALPTPLSQVAETLVTLR